MTSRRSAAWLGEGLDRISVCLARIEQDEAEEKAQLDRTAGLFRKQLRSFDRKIELARREGKWINSYFNLFETLGRPRLEEAHSNVLRWLLDPQESHGLKDRFLRGFLSLVRGGPIRPTAVAFVDRERRIPGGRNDIVIEGRGWRLVVENKIDDKSDETVKYARYWSARRKRGEKVLFTFLTPDGRTARSKKFVSLRYRRVRELVSVLTTDGEQGVLLSHFADHIRYQIES